MNIQHILTLSIDAIALFYSALMAANFVLRLLEEWIELGNREWGIGNRKRTKALPIPYYPLPVSQGICAEVLKPIFEEADKVSNTSFNVVIADPWLLPIEISEVYYLKKQLSTVQNRLLLLPSAPPQNNLVQLNIRQLKKQASAAKIKNYSMLTKAQLIQALSA